MQYVNLGNTGLRVSRVCLRMMSYGQHESREWALEEPYVPHPIAGH
jgi:1-deoxyxylulose-5-phosphate synthase